MFGEEAHKIVYLVSPPRSLSVGFLRMMQARGDFKIYHEPTINAHHLMNQHLFCRDWYREKAFQTFEEVKKAIFKEESNVFVKEMSFSLLTFIDEDLIKNENVYFVFLFRDPHHAIISLYKKIGSIVEDFHDAVGYEAAYEIFQKIVENKARRPLILFSEELASKPKEVIVQFCNYVGVPFDENSLTWPSLGENFSGYHEWHECKKTELTQHWHGNAIQSTQFGPLTTYQIDSQGNPTFSEIQDLSDREECKKAYIKALPYYLFFKDRAAFE
ncbi:MAG: hypothetical protein AB7H48_08400 [Parachlamydiales bacterium]|nr:hypothetical protein [Verrucomicrobiota bacterium]